MKLSSLIFTVVLWEDKGCPHHQGHIGLTSGDPAVVRRRGQHYLSHTWLQPSL